jgi:hypothetical protein
MKSPFPVLMPMTHHLQHIIAAEASAHAVSSHQTHCSPLPFRRGEGQGEGSFPVAVPPLSTRAKYIIVDLDGLEVAIVLPEALQHSMALQDAHRRLAVSAGFFHIARQGDGSFGRGVVIIEAQPSASLHLNPRPELDAEIITFTLKLMGLL